MKKLVFLILILITTITACGNSWVPGEGWDKYKAAWALMNASEIIIYKRVSSTWGEDVLAPLRMAVRTRTETPKEGTIPFCDVATVIISINDITFKTSPHLSYHGYKPAMFSEINASWYDAIEACSKQICKCNFTTNNIDAKSTDQKKETNIDKVETKTLLPYDEYDILLKETDKCSYAADILRKKLREQRFLYLNDRDEIIKEVLFCKNNELQSKLQNK